MTPVTGMGPTCCVHACLRPVRQPGGYCWHHWAGLSHAQRAAVQAEQPTEPIDSLEVIYRLPSHGEEAA